MFLRVISLPLKNLDFAVPLRILIFLWWIIWFLHFFLTVVSSSWSSISFFQLVCPMKINRSSCCNVFDTIYSCLDSLFFSLFCLVVQTYIRWMLNWLRNASNFSKNSSSEVINVSPMMAVESSFCIQWVGSCKPYRCLLRSALPVSCLLGSDCLLTGLLVFGVRKLNVSFG